MKYNRWNVEDTGIKYLLLILLLFATSLAQSAQFTLNVVDHDGNPVSGFRWLLQQDATFPVDPNNPATVADEMLSLDFHASYHPMVTGQGPQAGTGLNGNTDGSSVEIDNVPGGANNPQRYYVSVLPYSGHSISGSHVVVNQDIINDPVTVVVQRHPIPTAQVSIYLFHDNFPINGVPDLPEENQPPKFLDAPANTILNPDWVDWTQFSLFLEEPGGRYGIAGGQVIQDVFANPLGTTYIKGCDENGDPDADPLTDYGCLDADGAPFVDVLGDGTLHPDENGYLTIKNIAPGKYGVIIIAPTPQPGEDRGWQQTSTIEGTNVIDAWVKANEPQVFVEFGLPGPHVFMGFVKSTTDGGFPVLEPGLDVAQVTGQITDMHMSRPPNFEFFSGRPFPQCWVGINEVNAGGAIGQGIYLEPCDDTSSFSIANVPPGSYQLAIFDTNLDVVFAALPFSVDTAGGTCNGGLTCNFGELPVFNWFTRLNTGIFNDVNQNGFWDAGEAGIGPESQDVSLRWRDGSIYQNFPTDGEGLAPFDEAFPFFHWLVAEASFANKKATGATFVVDAGGFVDNTADSFESYGELTPQAQICTESQANNPDDPDFGCVVGDPIINPNTGNNLSRTETGPVLTAGFQGFLGQTSVMHFGKTDYTTFDFSSFPPIFVGENGGISGLVIYATTRAENEPQFAAAEEWEPGVPRIQVSLYADGDIDSFPQVPSATFPNGLDLFGAVTYGDVDWNDNGTIEGDDGIADDIDGNGCVGYADVDNYPFDSVDTPFPGPEDVDRSWTDGDATTATDACIAGDGDGAFDLHDAVQVTWTDSWDDSIPTGCQGLNNVPGVSVIEPPVTDDRCFDGLRNFNQIRPGVFDGGYAFADYDLDHLVAVNIPVSNAIRLYYFYVNDLVGQSNPDLAANLQLGLIPGDYIVEAATPPGYKSLKEEHKNVDFGDQYIPSAQALAVNCVGDDRLVPQYLSMVTKDGSGTDPGDGSNLTELAFLNDDGVFAPFAGELRPLCDRKQVPLSSAQNAAAEFFLMTDVPPVGNVSGVILNDLANEFNPNSPAFGEKFAPPFVPVAFYDWKGDLVSRVYSDLYGRYNTVVPSTFTANLPQPSGMSPNMLVSCMNDAGPIANPNYDAASDADGDGIDASGQAQFIIDPFFDEQYSQFCYTFQYMPGVITYLDTPVVPVAAFTGPGQFPVDCDRPTQTPMIGSVQRSVGSGGGGPFALAGQEITINSVGQMQVLNPEWDGIILDEKTIVRDYYFGSQGDAWLEDADGIRTPMTVNSWNTSQVFAEVPVGILPGDYQVVLTNGSGDETPMGVTLTVGVDDGGVERGVRPDGGTYDVWSVPGNFATIQAAIDNATSGDLILVAPGIYNELVIMWKPVKLQGWGAAAVTINARQAPTEKIDQWRTKVAQLVDDGSITQLPGQDGGPFGFQALGAALFPTEEGAGVFVAGPATGPDRFNRPANQGARIDGFTIIGASTAGGIVLNGYNQFMNIGNNRITTNAGFYGGGIRVGHPQITHEILDVDDPDYQGPGTNADIGDLVYDDAHNNRVRIHHNHVAKNGAFDGAGGGISLHTGADRYNVQKNWICGNFTSGAGGGIGHLGLSNFGVIEDNYIIFNESFRQTPGSSPAGGGVFVAGQPALTPEVNTGLMLSPGSGNVVINANLIRGNLAGAGDGGGMRIASVNGHDVAENLDNWDAWYWVNVYNNMVNNNVAAVAGGGISLTDALKLFIRNNTVANNDSTATGSAAFPAGLTPNLSVAQPAGIVTRYHSAAMSDLTNLEVDVAVLPPARQARAIQWQTFSDPVLRDDIIYHNRSFFWANFDDPNTVVIENGLLPSTCQTPTAPDTDPTCDITLVSVDDISDDLAVMSGIDVTVDLLNPRVSLLLDDGTPYHGSNTFITGDPGFVNEYFNTARDSTLLFPEFKVLQTAGAFDEGGNFLQVSYGPLSLLEPGASPNPANNTTLFDYHLTAESPAIDNGGETPATNRLSVDFDKEPRPTAAGESDIGADEMM